MGFALPSGVVNTDSVYYYADATLTFGPLVKQLTDQTLVIVDYNKVTPSIVVSGVTFAVDVSSNPVLVVSYVNLDQIHQLLTLLVSGGIVGQQYNISITGNTGGISRTDVLTIDIPSSGDCACDTINPVPWLYTQLPLGEPTQGYVNSAVRYFWGSAPPSGPNVMDQWFNPDTDTLYEWATDGVDTFWETIASPEFITDAPDNAVLYSRFNNNWTPTPIQVDAPSNGGNYLRRNNAWVVAPNVISSDAPAISRGYWRYNNAWVQDPIQTDAPNDGNIYVRSGQAWVSVPPPFPDAPRTNRLYSRINTTWQLDPIQADAPPDGQIWGRQNFQWVPTPPTGITDAPADGALYARQSGTWQPAYPESNPNNYQSDTDVAANYYPLANPAGYQTAVNVAAAVAPMMPRLGGTFTGGVQFNVGAIFPTTAQLVVRGGTAGQALTTDGNGNLTWSAPPGGVTDAPNDGTAYARESAGWVHLAHTDITDWTATLAPYALTANLTPVPVASNALPIMDSVANAGSGTTWSRADHVHPTDSTRYSASNPSGYQTAAQVTATLTTALLPYALTTAVPVASNSSPLMDGTAAPGGSTGYSRADHVHPIDTSRAPVTALANYLPLAGGTLTGTLVLAGDPSVALGAATMQYVNNQITAAIANANIDCGTF